ncbi:MAG: sulfur carrier protein ThiS [Betaproteobacteria bacterium]|nr:sulfur carrier protein ThiS [Betaproteobacteria bacterium]
MQPDPQAAVPELELSVNGEAVRSRAATLRELLRERGFEAERGGFACAVNGRFVPRAGWDAQALAAGDCVDIVAPVVGG